MDFESRTLAKWCFTCCSTSAFSSVGDLWWQSVIQGIQVPVPAKRHREDGPKKLVNKISFSVIDSTGVMQDTRGRLLNAYSAECHTQLQVTIQCENAVCADTLKKTKLPYHGTTMFCFMLHNLFIKNIFYR